MTAVNYYLDQISLSNDIINITYVLGRSSHVQHLLMYIVFKVTQHHNIHHNTHHNTHHTEDKLSNLTLDVIRNLYDICKEGYGSKSLLVAIASHIPAMDMRNINVITAPDNFHNLLSDDV